MTIYTKTGDEGFTTLPSGRRIRKSEPVNDALGTVDELSSHLGLCLQTLRVVGGHDPHYGAIATALAPIQEELLSLGAVLVSAADGQTSKFSVPADAAGRMECQIDDATGRMPPLNQFILPGGTELACRLHIARTVCRRAERALAALGDTDAKLPSEAYIYVNRLSDLLYTLARLANHAAGTGDVVWERPQNT